MIKIYWTHAWWNRKLGPHLDVECTSVLLKIRTDKGILLKVNPPHCEMISKIFIWNFDSFTACALQINYWNKANFLGRRWFRLTTSCAKNVAATDLDSSTWKASWRKPVIRQPFETYFVISILQALVYLLFSLQTELVSWLKYHQVEAWGIFSRSRAVMWLL